MFRTIRSIISIFKTEAPTRAAKQSAVSFQQYYSLCVQQQLQVKYIISF